jgi:hypothetical protein
MDLSKIITLSIIHIIFMPIFIYILYTLIREDKK